jgi:hypothetical protein
VGSAKAAENGFKVESNVTGQENNPVPSVRIVLSELKNGIY